MLSVALMVFFTELQSRRWFIIDEIENVSAELIAALEGQVCDSVRVGQRTWCTRMNGARRMWAGVDILMLGDFWQIPLVQSTSIQPIQARRSESCVSLGTYACSCFPLFFSLSQICRTGLRF